MRLVGVDYGRRRIGIAEADDAARIARGLRVIDRRKCANAVDEFLRVIKAGGEKFVDDVCYDDDGHDENIIGEKIVNDFAYDVCRDDNRHDKNIISKKNVGDKIVDDDCHDDNRRDENVISEKIVNDNADDVCRDDNCRDENAVSEKVIGKNRISKIIFGVPLDPDDGETEMSREVRTFANVVRQKMSADKFFADTEIAFIDESFSSKKAAELAMYRKKKARRDKSLTDKLAACLILQDYMDNGA